MIRAWSRGSFCLLIAFALLGQQQTSGAVPTGRDAHGPGDPAAALEQARQLMEDGRYRQAEGQLRGLLTQARRLPPPSQTAVSVLHTLGLVLHRQGRYQEAYPLLREAVETAERIPGLGCGDVVNLLVNLGVNYHERGQPGEAEKIYRRALALSQEEGCGTNHPGTAEALSNLATLAFARGHYEAAESMYRAALSGYVTAYGPAQPQTANVQENLGSLYKVRGRLTEAESLYQRSLETRESALGPNHPDVAQTLINLASIHVLAGDLDKAEYEARRALLIAKHAQNAEAVLAAAYVSLANALRFQKRNVEAEWTYRTALPMFEKQYGPNHPQVAAVLFNMAGACFDQKHYAEAGNLMRRALDIRQAAFSPGHAKVLATLEAYAKVLQKLHRTEEAAKIRVQVKTSFAGTNTR